MSKLLYNSSGFNIPNWNNTTIITRYDLLKLRVIKSKCNWILVTRFDFFLSLKWPKVDLSWTNDDAFAHFIKEKTIKFIIRSVLLPVDDCLNQQIRFSVPNLDHFVSSQTYQMGSLLVNCKVLHRCVMTFQILQCFQCKWIPHYNVAFLATTSNEPMFIRVNKSIDTFLMQVECFVLFVRKILDTMDMDKTIQGGWNNVVKVFVVLDSGYPPLMTLTLNQVNSSVFNGFKLHRFLFG